VYSIAERIFVWRKKALGEPFEGSELFADHPLGTALNAL
jgi:hypothetical protein